jgi:hypothetical protein
LAGAITDISDSLKIAYPPKAVETMVQENQVFRPRLSRELPSGARLTDGYEIRFGARLSPSNNVAQIADMGAFPYAKDATDRQFVFKPTIFAADYQIGILTRFVASSNVAGFNGGEMKRRPKEVMSNLGKYIESTYVGTDGSGIRGYVESEPGANQLKIKNPHGVRLLQDNFYFSERVSAGGAVRDSIDGRIISLLDYANRSFTYSGADQTPVADDPIYVVAELAQTLTSLYANGLRGQIDDGTLAQYIHTLDRTGAGNIKLKSLVFSNGGERRNLTEQLMIAANHDVWQRVSKKPSTLFMPETQVEKYVEFVAPQRRFPATGRSRQGMSTGYDVSDLHHYAPGVDMDFLISPDALPGEVYGLSWDAFFLYEAVRLQWLSGHDTSSLLLLPGTGTHKAGWGAYLVSIENFGTDFPLASWKMTDLKDRLLGD